MTYVQLPIRGIQNPNSVRKHNPSRSYVDIFSHWQSKKRHQFFICPIFISFKKEEGKNNSKLAQPVCSLKLMFMVFFVVVGGGFDSGFVVYLIIVVVDVLSLLQWLLLLICSRYCSQCCSWCCPNCLSKNCNFVMCRSSLVSSSRKRLWQAWNVDFYFPSSSWFPVLDKKLLSAF